MWIQKVNPLIKFLAAILLTCIAVLLKRPESLSSLTGFLFILGWIGGLRPSCRVLAGSAIMLSVFGLINLAFGTQPYDMIKNLLRLIAIFLIGPVLTLTVSPAELVQCLRRCRLPNGIALGLIVTFRFIPILLSEAVQIRDAARLRGLRWKPGSLRLTFRSVIMPLSFKTVSVADHVATALEVRGFSLRHSPTIMPGSGLGWKDIWFIMMAMFLPLILLLFERVLCFA